MDMWLYSALTQKYKPLDPASSICSAQQADRNDEDTPRRIICVSRTLWGSTHTHTNKMPVSMGSEALEVDVIMVSGLMVGAVYLTHKERRALSCWFVCLFAIIGWRVSHLWFGSFSQFCWVELQPTASLYLLQVWRTTENERAARISGCRQDEWDGYGDVLMFNSDS